MQSILVVHNIIRWLILLFGFWTVLNAVTGITRKRPFTGMDNKSNLFFMIFCDIQLLFGLLLFFSNGWYDKMKSGMGDAMKDPVSRFFTVEHSLLMILAWILVHVGRIAVKNAATDRLKHKKMLLFFGLALLLILAAIPWPFRAEIARPLYRWIN